MLRTASSLPLTGLLSLGSDPARFQTNPPACYRASWQLPGPDFHRQATTSLRTRANTMAFTSRCHLLLCWAHEKGSLAYLSLHEAEALIDGLLEGDELTAHAKDLLAKAPTVLKPDDQRVTTVRAAVETPGTTPSAPLKPAAVAHLARAVYDASDAGYAQSRTFRNRLIRLTLISLGAIGLMLAAFATNAIPLPVKGIAAPSHIETAVLVSLFGAAGALITAVGPLARATGTWNPFSLPYYQMLLKVALGPLFALIGVMMLASGLIPNVLFPMPLPDLLIWALVFGATQQAVTRVIDNRVNGLVSEKPANPRQESPGGGNASNAADSAPSPNTP
jgi:hypothetical protein